jgi:hypothetical protein
MSLPEKIAGGFIVLGIVCCFVWPILPDRWTDTNKYSNYYQIDSAQVHWNNRPTDCDFMHAPLGDKHCHYKKTVTAYNAAGYPVAGHDAPKGAKDAYGNAIISYDEGKTWTAVSGIPNLDLTVKTVEIGWTKVKD